MRLPSSHSISRAAIISGLIFVGLNIVDAWLSRQLIGLGGQEVNPLVIHYGANILIKGFLALAIALALVVFGKTKLLWGLNICMFALVLWLGAGLLHSS
jgi:hypothetical protein